MESSSEYQQKEAAQELGKAQEHASMASTGMSNRLLDLTTAATMLMAGADQLDSLDGRNMADPGTPPPPPPPSSQQLHQQKLIQLFESEHVANPTVNGMMTSSRAEDKPSGPTGPGAEGDINMFLHTVSMMAQADSTQHQGMGAAAESAGANPSTPGSKAPRRSFIGGTQGSDERPHKCPTCFAAFSRSHDLRRHQKTHTNLKEFRCDQCGKEFTRLDALRRHLRTTQGKGGCSSSNHGVHAGVSIGDLKGRKKSSSSSRHHRDNSAESTISSSSNMMDDVSGNGDERIMYSRSDASPQRTTSQEASGKVDKKPAWQLGHSAAASMLSAAAAAAQGQDLYLGMPQAEQANAPAPSQQQLLPSLINAAAAAAAAASNSSGGYTTQEVSATAKSPPKSHNPGSPKYGEPTAVTSALSDETQQGDISQAQTAAANAAMQNYAMAAAAMAGNSGNANPPMALISFDIYNSLMAHIAGLEQRVVQYEEETKKRNLAIETLSLKLREAHVDPIPVLLACGLASPTQAASANQQFNQQSTTSQLSSIPSSNSSAIKTVTADISPSTVPGTHSSTSPSQKLSYPTSSTNTAQSVNATETGASPTVATSRHDNVISPLSMGASQLSGAENAD